METWLVVKPWKERRAGTAKGRFAGENVVTTRISPYQGPNTKVRPPLLPSAGPTVGCGARDPLHPSDAASQRSVAVITP
eukprot:7379260-Prymnesium_polylepis.3